MPAGMSAAALALARGAQAGAAGGPWGVVAGIAISLAVSIGTQVLGHVLKPRKKTAPQEILPLEAITAELGTAMPVILGHAFIEKTMIIGTYQKSIVTVPAPADTDKK